MPDIGLNMAANNPLRGALCGTLLACACILSPATAEADMLSFLGSGHAHRIGPREFYVTPDSDGLYYLFANVNGTEIRFVVDSGSDDVVLTRKDARKAGIDVSKLQFSHDFDAETGPGYEADATIHSLSVGSLALNDFPVTVNEDGGASLLGMTFLRRMKSVEIRDNRLYLRW